jgi:hypothetical protein
MAGDMERVQFCKPVGALQVRILLACFETCGFQSGFTLQLATKYLKLAVVVCSQVLQIEIGFLHASRVRQHSIN